MKRYLKKDNKVYFNNNIVKNINPHSLTFLKNPFNGNDILQNHYIKDNKSVFLNGRKIPEASPEAFEIIGKNYSKDNFFIFYMDYKIENADLCSFIVLNR